MPIKIAGGLPARQTLEAENIFIMTDERAVKQDIRPLEIGIVNLMPTKISTETQLLRVLSNTPLQVNITLIRMAGHEARNTPHDHLERFYKTFADIKHLNFDGMIVTGAPVEHLDFNEVNYWAEIVEIMNYANKQAFSTLYICWAAQAALYHFYNVPKYALAQKLSGVFWHDVLNRNSHLFRGFNDVFAFPHSRHTEIRPKDVNGKSGVEILASSAQAGPAIMQAKNGNQIFITGHLEYDAETLGNEYERDLSKNLNPQVPENYYPQNDPSQKPTNTWRAHAHLFFSNWLNYYVYQDTPYDLAKLAQK